MSFKAPISAGDDQLRKLRYSDFASEASSQRSGLAKLAIDNKCLMPQRRGWVQPHITSMPALLMGIPGR